jgi:hypothetical protein
MKVEAAIIIESMTKPIHILNEMIRSDMRKRYPEIRHELLPSKPIRVNNANSLTQAVIKFIKLSGGQAERISVMGRTIDNRISFVDTLGHTRQIGSVTWIPGTMTRGSADISATIKGRSVKIEVKWGKDRQSAAQAKYQSDIERAGGIYLIVHTFDDFYAWYTNNIR